MCQEHICFPVCPTKISLLSWELVTLLPGDNELLTSCPTPSSPSTSLQLLLQRPVCTVASVLPVPLVRGAGDRRRVSEEVF